MEKLTLSLLLLRPKLTGSYRGMGIDQQIKKKKLRIVCTIEFSINIAVQSTRNSSELTSVMNRQKNTITRTLFDDFGAEKIFYGLVTLVGVPICV